MAGTPVREGPLRVAVVGAGAFGRNHLRVYRELQAAGHAIELVAVVDADSGVAAAAGEKFGVRWFTEVEECLRGFEAGCGFGVCAYGASCGGGGAPAGRRC